MEYSLPDLVISSELVERIQFSVSSRNAEAKLSECAAHVFAAPYSDNPHDINWQYVSSGMSCLLRNRELSKNGRKYMWSMSFCLYNASYGVLVWKAKLLPNSDYTAVADNFHVFALGEVNVLIGLMFSSKEKACELNTTYKKWHQERMRDDGKKGFVSLGAQSGSEPARFRKDMISKPCNFQHIQGTQAIDECMDIEKIKADIIAALFGLGTKAGRSETDGDAAQKSKKKKKEAVKQRLEFKEIILPQTQLSVSPPPATSPVGPGSPLPPPNAAGFAPEQAPIAHSGSPQGMTPTSGTSGQFNLQMTNGNGYQESSQENSALQQQQTVPDPMEQMLSKYGGESNSYEAAQAVPSTQNFRGTAPEEVPNYQNPASPAFQEYTSSQGSYTYNIDPPRLDLSLEKDFVESILFKSSMMTAN